VGSRLSQRIADALVSAGVSLEAGLLVGFSGGRDSVALVALLQEAGFGRLTLLHLDHGLRSESGADAEWCRQFGLGRGLEVVVERRELGARSGGLGVGLEEAGREARYAFFAQNAERLGVCEVVLGHHADDQVETFLFRLLRGAGSPGLGGMAPVSLRQEGAVSLRLLRPMLGVWREELDAWIAETGLSFREDASNADPRWARNRIRHGLLPEMERVMERPVKSALWRAAELLRAEADWLRESEGAAGEVGERLEVAKLRQMALAQRRLRIARWLAFHAVPEVGFELVEAVAGLAFERTPAKVNLPGGRHVRRRAGLIFVEDRAEGAEGVEGAQAASG
jgi:tRNA(Ile)-lysidine synthase